MIYKRKIPSLLCCYFLIISLFLGGILFGNHAITVVAQQRPIVRKYTVVIDAGHGGIDGGATSCTGQLESQINLDIALRLEDLLHLMGYDTVMIRRTDTSIHTQGNSIAQQKISDLKERVHIVNATENSILISIHQNFFADSRYSGAQVFYAPTAGSEDLAARMQSTMVSALNPGSRRQHKRGEGIYLMEHISCTGILVECGFLSHPEEEAKLRSPEYQKKLCSSIAATLSQYLSNT